MEEEEDAKHVKTPGRMEKLFPCLTCGKNFKRKEHLQGHEERIHGPNSRCCFDCRWCGQQFRHKGFWKRHEALHGAGPVRCLSCNENFKSSDELKKHVKEKHTRPKYCLMCSEVFHSKEALMLHVKSCAQSKSKTEDKPVDEVLKTNVCPVCKRCTSGSNSLKWAQVYYNGSAVSACQNCVESLSLEDVKHSPVALVLSCTLCFETFTSSRQLVFHKVQVHDDKDATQELLKLSKSRSDQVKSADPKSRECPICQKTFPCPAKLRIHVTSHLGEKPYSCPTCHKSFRRKDNLQQHQLIHSAKKPYTCPSCSESFRRQSQLRLHRAHAHGAKIYLKELRKQRKPKSPSKEVKPVQARACLCSYCGNSFKSKSALKEHESRIHSARDRLRCDDCGKSFSQHSYLTVHMLNHLGIAPYQCSTCQQCFSTSTQLRKHERSHSGALPYPCSVCGRLFAETNLLKMHMRIHTGDRPYVCPYCGKAFGHPSTLRTHKRIHTGDKPYRCDQCGMAFGQRSSLNYHIRSHRGERPYSCHICGKSYTRMATLNIHLTRHTGRKRVACPLCDFTCDTPKHLRKHAVKAHQGAQVTPVKTQSSENQRRSGGLYTSLDMVKATYDTTAGVTETDARPSASLMETLLTAYDASSKICEPPVSGACSSMDSNEYDPHGSEQISETTVNTLSGSHAQTDSVNRSLFCAPAAFPQSAEWNNPTLRTFTATPHPSPIQGSSSDALQLPIKAETCMSTPSTAELISVRPGFSDSLNQGQQNCGERYAKTNSVYLNQSHRQPETSSYHMNTSSSNNPDSTAHHLSLSNEILYALNIDQTDQGTGQSKLIHGPLGHTALNGHYENPVNSGQITMSHFGKPSEFSGDDVTGSHFEKPSESNQTLMEEKEVPAEEKKTRDQPEQTYFSDAVSDFKNTYEAKKGEGLSGEDAAGSQAGLECAASEADQSEDVSTVTSDRDDEEVDTPETTESFNPQPAKKRGRKPKSDKNQWTPLVNGSKRDKAKKSKPKRKGSRNRAATSERGNVRYFEGEKNSAQESQSAKSKAIKTESIVKLEDDDLPEELEDNSEGPVSCPICGKIFTLAANLPKHMRLHSGERPYVCSVCGCSFPRSDYLKYHMRTSHPHSEGLTLSCTLCGEGFSNLRQLEDHVTEFHEGLHPFSCNLCHFSCLQLPDLKRHMKARHLNTDNFHFQCALCHSVFPKPSILKEHVISTHKACKQEAEDSKDFQGEDGDDTQGPERLEIEGGADSLGRAAGQGISPSCKYPYKCGHCGQLYQNASNLGPHMSKKHSGEKRFKCGICQISYLAAHELGRHMLSHNGQRPCTCDRCGKAFPDWNQLRKHMVVHSDKKPYKCSHCDQAFKHLNTLRTHERIHSGSKPFKCKTCDAAFAQLSSLKYHEKTHMGLKPYMCQICGNSYTRATTLNVHMNHHNGLRRLSCPLCEYMCDKPKVLRKHVARVHPGEMLDEQALKRQKAVNNRSANQM